MSASDNLPDYDKIDAGELVESNKSLLKENRALREENARLIRELERHRKKKSGI